MTPLEHLTAALQRVRFIAQRNRDAEGAVRQIEQLCDFALANIAQDTQERVEESDAGQQLEAAACSQPES